MTLDEAQDTFRAMPSEKTAETYLNVAVEYVYDGMIQAGELDRIYVEISAFRGMHD